MKGFIIMFEFMCGVILVQIKNIYLIQILTTLPATFVIGYKKITVVCSCYNSNKELFCTPSKLCFFLR